MEENNNNGRNSKSTPREASSRKSSSTTSKKRVRPGNTNQVTPTTKSQKRGCHPQDDNARRQEDEDHHQVLLTPHTLRLLKLVQGGSHDHAALAAAHLTTITAQSSPLVLWDVLGRLQFYLKDKNWQTRRNAALAMQGVARHLPLSSRREFLEGTNNLDHDKFLWLTLHDIQTQVRTIARQGRLLWAYAESKAEQERVSWEERVVNQLDQEQLQSHYRENDDTHHDEQNSNNNHKETFVQQRVERQRRILAQRLGLAGLLQATGDKSKSFLSDTITKDDLAPDTTTNRSGSKTNSNNLPINNNNSAKSGIRALLVMEMERETQDATAIINPSHKNPQTILATELLFRVLDPSWYVRHGALLGLLSLLRAWHSTTTTTTTPTANLGNNHNHNNKVGFGAWPQDILARCLCVLILDRFGDYSGTTTTVLVGQDDDSNNDSNTTTNTNTTTKESSSVVAPVREVAGQLLSMVWLWATPVLQQETLQLLCQLATGSRLLKTTNDPPLTEDDATTNEENNSNSRTNDWETRHGSLLAIKYIVALAQKELICDDSTAFGDLTNLASSVALQCLKDTSDDVQSVAAQILLTLASTSMGSLHAVQQDSSSLNWKQKTLCCLWQVLKSTNSMSSSLLDLMNLCASLLMDLGNQTKEGESFQSTPPPIGLGISDQNTKSGSFSLQGSEILRMFQGYLGHEFVSVRVAALRSIANVVEPIWWDALQNYQQQKRHDAAILATLEALDGLHREVFMSFLRKHSVGLSEEVCAPSEFQAVPPENDLFDCRTQAWSKLNSVLRQRYNLDSLFPAAESLTVDLLLTYFGIQKRPGTRQVALPLGSFDTTTDEFECMLLAANALAELLTESIAADVDGRVSERQRDVITTIEFIANAMIHSPWKRQCERACLLTRAIYKKAAANAGQHWGVASCRESIARVLTAPQDAIAPIALAMAQTDEARLLLCEPGLSEVRDSALLNALGAKEKNVDGVLDIWKRAIYLNASGDSILGASKGEVASTLSAMQLFALMAGAVLPGSRGESLPTKKATPVIRPIMTSLRNETDLSRLAESCDYIAELLILMFEEQDSVFAGAREKVLNNLLEIVEIAAKDGSTRVADFQIFSRVLRRLIHTLAKQNDSLECLTPIHAHFRVLNDYISFCHSKIVIALKIFDEVSGALPKNSSLASATIGNYFPAVVQLACVNDDQITRGTCMNITQRLCREHTVISLKCCLFIIAEKMEDREQNSARLAACQLLKEIVQDVGLKICPYVRQLLPTVMSLMADSLPDCATAATSIFAYLVRAAPLVPVERVPNSSHASNSVVDHLIHGKPLPSYQLPVVISESLQQCGVTLRQYQQEGVAWLRFLQTVNLNGALCDAMGLGKTLQALIGVAIAHVEGRKEGQLDTGTKSLVICPSSVVGHWEAEIKKFFPGEAIFHCFVFAGNRKERADIWEHAFDRSNIIVTSYSVLRSEINTLSKPFWKCCILDEGHLLKNPNTATALASRRLRAHHKLILTGTPVQNRVQEIFATFDFLMPNFLGTAVSFNKEFARPITNGHLPGASPQSISDGIKKLKLLHQQVLPFVLRREKDQVLKELPPKCLSTVPCKMSSYQHTLYHQFLATEEAKKSVEELKRALQRSSALENKTMSDTNDNDLKLGSSALRSLLYLRLLCTHPLLVKSKSGIAKTADLSEMSLSGKLLALMELLRECGLHHDEITGADNDVSLLYCNENEVDTEDEQGNSSNLVSDLLRPTTDDRDTDAANIGSKCLVFAQFTQSLDVIEELLIKRHMPSLRYLRLDGRVPSTKRSALVDAFNSDPSIKLMLLTTRVGGLGLNLQGADTVIFLENDFNPFADLQAADRAHRIGQTKTVNVYRLVMKDSIEERIMELQEKKIAISTAIVNSDNSTMFSMGTDRLLDIFTSRSESNGAENNKENDFNLDALVETYKDEYSSLSVTDFLKALQK